MFRGLLRGAGGARTLAAAGCFALGMSPLSRIHECRAPCDSRLGSASPCLLTDAASLNELGSSPAAVVLVLPPKARAADVSAARAALRDAGASVAASPGAGASATLLASARVWEADESAGGAAEVLASRAGLASTAPYVLILANFASTEKKYASQAPPSRPPNAGEVAAQLRAFLAGTLAPTVLGQARPPGDLAPHSAHLREVVTESFDELVLRESARRAVLLAGTSPRCDACKALGARLRMFATLSSRHYDDALRVATFDIVNNDRPLAYMPERVTPTLRVFVQGKGSLLPMDGGGGGGSHVTLPTIPELLQATAAASHGRVEITAAARADAVRLEAEAVQLDAAYEQALQYMELHAAFSEALAAAGSNAPTAAADTAAERELRERISRAYAFVAYEAGEGGAEAAAKALGRVADLVSEARVDERVRAAWTPPLSGPGLTVPLKDRVA